MPLLPTQKIDAVVQSYAKSTAQHARPMNPSRSHILPSSTSQQYGHEKNVIKISEKKLQNFKQSPTMHSHSVSTNSKQTLQPSIQLEGHVTFENIQQVPSSMQPSLSHPVPPLNQKQYISPIQDSSPFNVQQNPLPKDNTDAEMSEIHENVKVNKLMCVNDFKNIVSPIEASLKVSDDTGDAMQYDIRGIKNTVAVIENCLNQLYPESKLQSTGLNLGDPVVSKRKDSEDRESNEGLSEILPYDDIKLIDDLTAQLVTLREYSADLDILDTKLGTKDFFMSREPVSKSEVLKTVATPSPVITMPVANDNGTKHINDGNLLRLKNLHIVEIQHSLASLLAVNQVIDVASNKIVQSNSKIDEVNDAQAYKAYQNLVRLVVAQRKQNNEKKLEYEEKVKHMGSTASTWKSTFLSRKNMTRHVNSASERMSYIYSPISSDSIVLNPNTHYQPMNPQCNSANLTYVPAQEKINCKTMQKYPTMPHQKDYVHIASTSSNPPSKSFSYPKQDSSGIPTYPKQPMVYSSNYAHHSGDSLNPSKNESHFKSPPLRMMAQPGYVSTPCNTTISFTKKVPSMYTHSSISSKGSSKRSPLTSLKPMPRH